MSVTTDTGFHTLAAVTPLSRQGARKVKSLITFPKTELPFLDTLMWFSDRGHGMTSPHFKKEKTEKRKEKKKVKSKETVGNSWTVLKVILGHKYNNNH